MTTATRNSTVKRVLKTDYHRNGVGGNGFTVSLFEPSDTYVDYRGHVGPSDMSHHEGPFLAIQFADQAEDEGHVSMYTAIIALDDLYKWSQMRQEEYDALPRYNRGLGAWRGDNFAAEIHDMVTESDGEV